VAGVHSSLGVAAIHGEDYETARRHLETAVALATEDPDRVDFDATTILSNLGIVHSRMGDQERARELHERALATMERTEADHPRRVIPMINIAATYERQERYADAIPWLEKASAILSARPEKQARAGDMEAQIATDYVELGDPARARDHLRRALGFYDRDTLPTKRLNPETTRARLGRLLLEDGDEAAAAETLSTALHALRAKRPAEDDPLFVSVEVDLARALAANRSRPRARARGEGGRYSCCQPRLLFEKRRRLSTMPPNAFRPRTLQDVTQHDFFDNTAGVQFSTSIDFGSCATCRSACWRPTHSPSQPPPHSGCGPQTAANAAASCLARSSFATCLRTRASFASSRLSSRAGLNPFGM
jgi:hypothetical protein